MPYDFVQIDAFTDRPLYGNPAAVVFDADDIPTEKMQKIAQEMNLSETVFILKPFHPDADYGVRIFTPKSELPFAGHPTVAAAYSVLMRFPEKSSTNMLLQECGIGLVPVEVVRSDSNTIFRMTQGTPNYRSVNLSRDTMAKMLGCTENDLGEHPFEVVSTGVPWLIVELSHFAAISNLNPNLGLITQQCKALNACGITVFAERPEGAGPRIRVRTFAPGEGVAEDPVCGSGNGSVLAYIVRHKHGNEQAGAYVAEQGIEMGRDGEIYASWERINKTLRIRIGGAAVISVSGKLHL